MLIERNISEQRAYEQNQYERFYKVFAKGTLNLETTDWLNCAMRTAQVEKWTMLRCVLRAVCLGGKIIRSWQSASRYCSNPVQECL
jgi:ADP-ribosylglycohydrolase